MSPQIVAVLAVLAGIGALAVVRNLHRSATRARQGMRVVSRTGGIVLRTLATAAGIVTIQWAVVTTAADPLATAVALTVPALFAGSSIARLLTTTDLAATTAKWRHHR